MPARRGFAGAAVAGDEADAAHVDEVAQPGAELGEARGLEEIVGGQVLVERVAREGEVLGYIRRCPRPRRACACRSRTGQVAPLGELDVAGVGVAFHEAVGECIDTARDVDAMTG
jgi:hypothetical protein